MKTLPYKVTANNTPKLRPAAKRGEEAGGVAQEVVTPLKVCRNTTH